MDCYGCSPEIGSPFRQGEIFSNVVEVRLDPDSLTGDPDAEFELTATVHPIAVLVTQDCDLDWDFKARIEADPIKKSKSQNKLLPNLLFCEVLPAEELRGNQALASDIWKRVKQNQDERYHYLFDVRPELEALGQGFPPLAIDFKRLFTIPTEEMYKRVSFETRRRTILQGPFMQDLSNRFAYYHLRVALPSQDATPKPLPLDAPQQIQEPPVPK